MMNTNDNNNYNFRNDYNLLSYNEKEIIKQKVDSYRNELLAEKKGLISLALPNIRDTEYVKKFKNSVCERTNFSIVHRVFSFLISA